MLKQKLLILDLDETLVHATETKLSIPHDYIYEEYYVYKRPFLKTFLQSISTKFKLAVWSSAGKEYVEAIVNELIVPIVDLEFIWSEEKCTPRRNFQLDKYVNEKHLKKVKKLGYSLNDVLIVDDTPEKVRENFGNAIYINAFEGQQEDKELSLLLDYINSISDAFNFRKIEKRGWRS